MFADYVRNESIACIGWYLRSLQPSNFPCCYKITCYTYIIYIMYLYIQVYIHMCKQTTVWYRLWSSSGQVVRVFFFVYSKKNELRNANYSGDAPRQEVDVSRIIGAVYNDYYSCLLQLHFSMYTRNKNHWTRKLDNVSAGEVCDSVFLLSRRPFDDNIEIGKDPISIFINSEKLKFISVEFFFKTKT